MELFKGIIAAIITVTLSSQTLCAPPQSKPTTIQILVTYVIPSKIANATYEMRNMYHFINSTSYLFEPPFSRFPPQINTQSCTLNQQLKDNLTIAYEKMDIFRSPLYMALSYEENQGPLHNLLAQMLWDISTGINATSVMLSRKMHKNTFPVPTTTTGNFMAQMNHIIRVYLQTLVQGNLLVR
ncbi:unnamed protein product [Porites evermanni]|uniref:Uncharacterized protein n=1 Tax=Porites evermanni TaxID=104178 RepID=A0ABN8QI47_9CNID|nr:unnamed protein product [Porites evermanni]